MPRKYMFVSICAVLGMAGSAAAEQPEGLPASVSLPPIEIVDADYGGTGCPEGTASVIMIGNTLTILFDDYVASTHQGHQTARKTCNYAVALKINPGYTVALVQIDYRGFANIPFGGFGKLRAEYFWAGHHGPVYQRVFPSGYMNEWKETDFVGGAVWSSCGGEVIARGNTSVLARKSSPYSAYEAELAVDSLDLQAGVIYHFEWELC